MSRPPLRAPALVGVCLLAAAACTDPAQDGGSGRELPEISVLAAASMRDVLPEIAETRAVAHFSFGSSTALAEQFLDGNDADVFVSASPEPMALLVKAGVTRSTPVTVARNRLEIVVPAGNPGQVRSLADLARPELAVAVCDPSAPCGAATETAFRRAGVAASVDTEEPDVRRVLTKVTLGEADVGIVYRTDVQAAGADVQGIALPEEVNVLTEVQAATLRYDGASEPSRAAADELLAALSGTYGRAALTAAGFDVS